MTELKEELEQKVYEEISEVKQELLKQVKNSMVNDLATGQDICEISINSYSQYDDVIDSIINYLKEEDMFSYIKKETYYNDYYGYKVTDVYLIVYPNHSYEEGELRYIERKKEIELEKKKKYRRNLLITAGISIACILTAIKLFM